MIFIWRRAGAVACLLFNKSTNSIQIENLIECWLMKRSKPAPQHNQSTNQSNKKLLFDGCWWFAAPFAKQIHQFNQSTFLLKRKVELISLIYLLALFVGGQPPLNQFTNQFHLSFIDLFIDFVTFIISFHSSFIQLNWIPLHEKKSFTFVWWKWNESWVD